MAPTGSPCDQTPHTIANETGDCHSQEGQVSFTVIDIFYERVILQVLVGLLNESASDAVCFYYYTFFVFSFKDILTSQ